MNININIRLYIPNFDKHLNVLGDIVFSLKEKFQFLENGVDFPFYNDIPKLSVAEWLLVLAGILLMIALIMGLPVPEQYFDISICLVVLIPALYICKGNYGLFFKIPKLKDLLTIIKCAVLYIIYGEAAGIILLLFKYNVSGNSAIGAQGLNLISIVNTLIHLMGEELFKILMLLLLMYVIYRLTNNRSLSIGLGLIITMLTFGMCHYYAYDGRILQILLIPGLGSIFPLYGYMKTKNVFVSYLIHLLTDLAPFIMLSLTHI